MALCIEKKLTLSGRVHEYTCELLHFEPGFGILKYVIDRDYDVAGVKLCPGDITYALYWIDRPYTLYIWHLKNGSIVHYFNIADQVSLQPLEFIWRDLTVDILIDNDHTVHVLDEHELPDDLNPELREYIRTAKACVLKEYPSIMREAESLPRTHFPQNPSPPPPSP